ncbi:hypothetical protein STEG23_023993 [Scotinomys teguina]
MDIRTMLITVAQGNDVYGLVFSIMAVYRFLCNTLYAFIYTESYADMPSNAMPKNPSQGIVPPGLVVLPLSVKVNKTSSHRTFCHIKKQGPQWNGIEDPDINPNRCPQGYTHRISRVILVCSGSETLPDESGAYSM